MCTIFGYFTKENIQMISNHNKGKDIQHCLPQKNPQFKTATGPLLVHKKRAKV